jgi:serine protease AprX
MAGFINVLCLSDDDRQTALARLRPKGNVQQSGSYVFGLADSDDVKALEAAGLIVEQLPAKESLAWLDPKATPAAATTMTAAAAPTVAPLMKKLAESSADSYVIQLKGPLQPEWKAALEKAGLPVGRWVLGNGMKLKLTTAQRQAVEAMPFVERVVPFSTELSLRRLYDPKSGRRRKVAPDTPAKRARPRTTGHVVAAPNIDEPATPAPALYMFDIKCHDRSQLPEVGEALRADARIKRLEQGRVRIRIWVESSDSPATGALLASIGVLPQVSVVEPYEYPKAENSIARSTIGIVEASGQPTLPWDGTGQVVAVADTGVDEAHPDLKNRLLKVIERVPIEEVGDPIGHGTHVCGSICGDGTASGGKVLGIAPGAKLIVQVLTNGADRAFTGLPLNLGELFQQAYDLGARIHNNSWGADSEGLFTIDADEVDEFIHTHPDCLVLISAGNSGRQDDPAESHDPLARMALMTLTSPGTAKNALTVGACCSERTDGPYQGKHWNEFDGARPAPTFAPVSDEPITGDVGVVAAFSGRGPTDADQVKPDLLAPGTAILSTRSAASDPAHPFDDFGDRYCFNSGTSMASPVVAGAAAIVRQYFVDHRKHAKPSAALLKATLINGTVWSERKTVQDAETGMPNYHQGYGRLDLSRTVPAPDRTDGFALAFVDLGLDAPESLNKFTDGRDQWRKTLTVQAGLPLSLTLVWTDYPGHGLQHNLNLLVITPDGRRVFGNPNLLRPSFAKGDRSNNVEMIRFDAPNTGVYVVHVLAYNTPYGDQGFSLVATGRLAVSDFV